MRQIKLPLSGQKKLSHLLFGHNLEHTRGCVYGGLSGELLRNRKFAGMPTKNQGCAEEWHPIGNVFCQMTNPPYTRHCEPSKMARKNEIHALSLQNLSEGLCGVEQGGLYLEKNKTYLFRIVVHAQYAACLTASLSDGDKTLVSHTFPVSNGDWETVSFSLSCPGQTENGKFSVAFGGKNEVTFGAFSLLPGDHFHGMRRDVTEKLKALSPKLLRWPGGNFAGEYRFKDGFLPPDRRAPIQSVMEEETQPFTHGYDNHEIGTDEFLALCREVGAEPMITVNLFWDSPKDCADWVEYCNGDVSTPYGRLRAERGHPEPYNVRFWALGNEMGYAHMEGPDGAAAYYRAAKACGEAMLARFPNLTLVSSGPYLNEEWIKNSTLPLASIAPFTSHHFYGGFDETLKYVTDEQIRKGYERMMQTVGEAEDSLRVLSAGLNGKCRISLDEWNGWFAWYRRIAPAEGIFVAKMLHLLAYGAERYGVGAGCFFQPVGEGLIEVTPREARFTPMGQVFAFYADHFDGEYYEADETFFASTRGNTVTLSLLNDSFAQEKEFSVFSSLPPVSSVLLESPDLLPGTLFETKELAYTWENETVNVILPPHSTAKLIFEKANNKQ